MAADYRAQEGGNRPVARRHLGEVDRELGERRGRRLYTFFAVLGIPVGVVLGLIGATLVTEPLEGVGTFGIQQVMKTVAFIVVEAGLAWGAFRKRDSAWAPLLLAGLVCLPSWRVVMGDEVGALGLALAFAWAGMSVFTTRPERTALVVGGFFAAFMNPSSEAGWFGWAVAFGLLVCSVVPFRFRRVASPLGALVSLVASAWFAWPDAVDRAERGDVWILCSVLAIGAIALAISMYQSKRLSLHV